MASKAKATLDGDSRRPVVFMNVNKLLLDSENPRLASGSGGDTQIDLLRVLWTEMAVEDVAMSIAANGFFPEETLFVIPNKSKMGGSDDYVVVEGNRRLAAVLLLIRDDLREKIKATDLPHVSEKARAKLQELPVAIYPDRKSLWEYFGFRHINGPKPWDAFSKATYVAFVHERYKFTLDTIAEKIGDRHSTVRRLYRGIVVLRQAEDRGVFNKEDRIRNRFFFSHLYTAVDQPEFQKFLGITPDGSLRLNPVPPAKLGQLAQLMVWLYGSRSQGKEPIVRTQNPDLNTLRVVVGKSAAISALESGFSLERAHENARGDKLRFREALTKAKEDLIQANGAMTLGFSGEEELVETMSEITELATEMLESMERSLTKKKRRK